MNDAALERLGDKSITARAGAAQELAVEGSLQAVLPLLTLAKIDKSRSVKLVAAAAAADILARHRGAQGQAKVPKALRSEILEALKGVDPANLPSALLCYAAFPTPQVIKRLTRMLRDMRQGVRTAAALALRRMALSAAHPSEGTALREWVAAALEHPKLVTDSAIEIVRLIGQVGWAPLRPRVEAVAGRNDGTGETAREALARLDARLDAASWAGIWIDEGKDVMELGPSRDGAWHTLGDVELDGVEAIVDGERTRRIWARRLGEEGEHEALQRGGRTFWRLTPERAIQVVLEQDARLVERPGAVDVLLPMIDATGGAAGMRAAALLLARTGDSEGAMARLERPLQGKRPRNDLFFIRALAHRVAGDEAASRADLERYLEKAKKSEPWAEEARSLLG